MNMRPSQENAVAITRVSSKRQEEEGYSLPAQKRFLESYAINQGLVLLRTFEIAESASKAVQRKIFKEAMKFIEEQNTKHLVVEKVDRHVRNLQDAVATHDWLTADEDRRLHFVKDSLVMHKNSKSQEWLNWGIRVVMAKNYIDNLREEAMKGWSEKLAQGWMPSPPPIGYMNATRNGKKIHVPDPKTKKHVVDAFMKYLEPGENLDSTTAFMEKMGLRTRSGHPFARSKVQKMLCNTYYIGTIHFNGKDYPGAQELFLPKRLFAQVQAKLHRGRPRHYGQHNSPLKGLIRCNDCGSVVTWQHQKGRYYGVCRRLTEACKQSKMLREDEIEAMIMEQLEKLVCPSPEVIDWLVSEMQNRQQERIEERERQLEALQSQLKRLIRMEETLYDDKLSGEITKERYEVKHEEITEQREDTESQINQLDNSLSQLLELRLTMLELSQKAASIYAKKSAEQKRLIISKLFSKLSLQAGSLSVKYSKFAEIIAEKVQKTTNLMEGQI
jgi:site-specific DNA recombinase